MGKLADEFHASRTAIIEGDCNAVGCCDGHQSWCGVRRWRPREYLSGAPLPPSRFVGVLRSSLGAV